MKYLTVFMFVISASASIAYGQLSPWEAVPLMQKGINLGNTLEPPLEGGWNNPPAQEYYFDLYKDAGFYTVRIPVRWDEHTLKTSPYTIAASWLQRVEQIVDWALERDLFVIINSHHDTWIKENYTNPDIRARFDSVWSQISVHFKDKPEKLFFEVLNEPYGLTKSQNDDMHARVLSIIRKTNPTRIVIFQGHNWGGSDELITAAIPDDEFIMGSFHSYDPYLFGLEGQGTWGTAGDYATLENKFKAVKSWSDLHHIPVFLGEFGAVRKCDYNSRMKHYRAYIENSQKFGFISCAWDDGGDFRIMERSASKWDEVKDILISTSALSPRIILKTEQDTMIRVSWNNVPLADSIYIEYRTASGSYRRMASLPGDSTKWFHTDATEEVYHYYRIISRHGNELRYSEPQRIFLNEYVPKIRGFFLGAPIPLPGTVQAEDFDSGGEGLTWHESSITNLGGAYRFTEEVDIFSANIGYYISNVWPGEWFEHTVDIETGGSYIIDFHVGSSAGGGTFILSIGDASTDTMHVPPTQSSINFTIISDTVPLSQGIQIMRFTILDIPYFSIDKMVFSLVPFATSVNENSNESFMVRSFNNNLLVEFGDNSKIKQLQFLDGNGRLLKTIYSPSPQTSIPLDNLAIGLYFLRTISDHGYEVRKIIINK